MIILALFQWWYGQGWAMQVKAVASRTGSVAEMFSIGTLLRTLFAPWKQITSVTHNDQSVSIKMHVGLDNMISRLVGFVIRSTVLQIAVFTMTVTVLANVILAILWPLMPFFVLFVIPLGFAL